MNTKQKLTLGIAAIFMVTLTIVGVTYAYFVTQVTGDNGTQSVNVQTASIGIKYGDGSPDITVENVLPGATFYKSFTVTNDLSEAPVLFAVGVEAKYANSADDVQFISSGDGVDVAATCYAADSVTNRDSEVSEESAKVAGCYSGNAYNNIKISMYEYTGTGSIATSEEVEALITAGTDLTEVVKDTAVLKATSAAYDSIQKLGANQTIAGMADATDPETKVVKKYLVKVEYVDAQANQNIETEAALKLRVNISLPQ